MASVPQAALAKRNGYVLDTLWALTQTMAGQWLVILALIFGGCCSNALTLEMATSQNPKSGSLITFAQFVLVTLFGLRKRFVRTKPSPNNASSASSKPNTSLLGIRLKPLAVPLRRWVIQVILFFAVSLLNNIAFGYKIPMAVHIIFRSGGLVVNMIMAYLTQGKRYPFIQVVAVILISIGISSATLSATAPSKPHHDEGGFATSSLTHPSYREFGAGILLLTLALVLSAFLGFSQEKTNKMYGRGHWEEGMFFLHFLALPMFALPGMSGDLTEQIRVANSSPPVPIYSLLGINDISAFGGGLSPWSGFDLRWPEWIPFPIRQILEFLVPLHKLSLPPLSSLTIPSFWIPLFLNITTQLLCVNGVNRLTSRVSSLTVTLILALRKAVSLVISVVLVGRSSGTQGLWVGSAMVLFGTVIYTLGSGNSNGSPNKRRDQAQRKVE